MNPPTPGGSLLKSSTLKLSLQQSVTYMFKRKSQAIFLETTGNHENRNGREKRDQKIVSVFRKQSQKMERVKGVEPS